MQHRIAIGALVLALAGLVAGPAAATTATTTTDARGSRAGGYAVTW